MPLFIFVASIYLVEVVRALWHRCRPLRVFDSLEIAARIEATSHVASERARTLGAADQIFSVLVHFVCLCEEAIKRDA